jgi:tRNA1Val (adenine37-N6)-methyltransferase
MQCKNTFANWATVEMNMKQVRDFRFKQFTIIQNRSTHKVGTDGVLLGAWISIDHSKTILDIGTGSGLIALMLAQRTLPDVIIDAVEVQHEDAEQARENASRSPWKNRISVHETMIQQFSTNVKYDLIVSNPPFFINSWLPPNQKRTTVRHSESLSFQDLLQAVIVNLSPDGRFGLILPFTEASLFISLARSGGLYLRRKCDFKTRSHKPVERILMEFSFIEQPLISDHLLLYDGFDGEEWSVGYKALTKDFYLNI